jgi:uncharacterized cofD-like protein
MIPSVEQVRIVAFGGGTGSAALAAGLKDYTPNITVVVTVTDNGGSSGILRNDFDMVAPGDIRNCLLALSDVDPLVSKVFQYRFPQGEFKGHCFGNLFITVLTQIVGNFEESIRVLNRLLQVKGRVLPAANAKVSLVAHHLDGTKSTGEVQISRSRKPIERIELRPWPVVISSEIRQAVREADLFIFGPGSLFTSVVPNLLLEGLMEEIQTNGSPSVYIGNIMTQPGETDGFKLSDHIRALRRHVGAGFPDYVIAQSGELPLDIIEKYRVQGAIPVAPDLEGKKEFSTIRVLHGNFYREGSVARHDSALLARTVFDELLLPIARRGLGPAPSPAGIGPGLLLASNPHNPRVGLQNTGHGN